MKKKYLKALAEKWGELVTELDVASDRTLPAYDDGKQMHEAALAEIRRLKNLDSDSRPNARDQQPMTTTNPDNTPK